MAVLKCKMCGGNLEAIEGQNYATCDSCGSTMTLPKVNDERIVNLFNRATHYRQQNEFDKALATYENILEEDNENAEAHWGCVLSRYGIEYVEDTRTHERIPTCHRVQNNSILADLDYKEAIKYAPDNHSAELYKSEAERISEIQKGILNIARNEKPYDIFICYKESDVNGQRTIDSTLAQDIYFQLTNEGYKVFFSRITLEDKLGQEYEPYIFAALNSAKVMLVVGTKAEYFNAVWVKNEWARFLDIAKKDKSKLIIPCYRDMDAYDLPDELSVFQSQDMSKIGFIQDLTRGIKKVLQKEIPQPSVAIANNTPEAFNSETILKRAFMLLEDAEWQKADALLEQVLNHEPENALGHLGKLMIDVKVNKEENLGKRAVDFSENANYQKTLRFANDDLKERLISYHNGALEVLEQIKAKKMQKEQEEAIRLKQQQEQDAKSIKVIKENKKAVIKQKLPFICASVIMACIAFIPYGKLYLYPDVTMLFGIFNPFLCLGILLWCLLIGWKYFEKININKRKGNFAEAEQLSIEYKDKTIPLIKKWGTFLNVIMAVLLIAVFSYLPAKYNNAVKLYENGDYEAAAEAFEELRFYKDSFEMKKASEEMSEKQELQAEKQGSIQSGKIITMGTYNNHTLDWDVIGEKNGSKLLLCRESFEEIPYDEENSITTWEVSYIRKWCNSFYNNAFASAEKNKIILSTLQNIDFDGNKGTTEDYVFALSYNEANEFLSNLTEEARKHMENTESDAFWLRTISNNRYPKYSDIYYKISYPYIVWGKNCEIDDDNYYAIINGHVRPAMWIKGN